MQRPQPKAMPNCDKTSGPAGGVYSGDGRPSACTSSSQATVTLPTPSPRLSRTPSRTPSRTLRPSGLPRPIPACPPFTQPLKLDCNPPRSQRVFLRPTRWTNINENSKPPKTLFTGTVCCPPVPESSNHPPQSKQRRTDAARSSSCLKWNLYSPRD